MPIHIFSTNLPPFSPVQALKVKKAFVGDIKKIGLLQLSGHRLVIKPTFLSIMKSWFLVVICDEKDRHKHVFFKYSVFLAQPHFV